MQVRWEVTAFAVVLCVANGQEQKTFNNPIFDRDSADPAVFRLGDDYYLIVTQNGDSELTVYKSRQLYNFRNSESKVAYKTEGDQRQIWASEMHIVDGDLYLYFGMAGGGTNHRIYAIQAENATNPMGSWGRPVKLMPEYDRDVNDLSIMQHGNGKRYFMWSGGYNKQGLGLWIAPMLDALRVGEPKTILRYAMADWETQGGPLNAGPNFLYRNGISYLIFSASSTFGPDFCLGMMSIPADRDPMVPENWWFGKNAPVFWRNDAESVYAVGHASFTTSPDETETWMVYHGSDRDNNIGGNRVSRVDRVDWDASGVPVFPRPSGYGKAQAIPSEGRTTPTRTTFTPVPTETAAPSPTGTENSTAEPTATISPTPKPAPQPSGSGAKIEQSDGLSGGAIAGIVIGVLLGVGLIAGVGYYFTMIRNRRPGQGSGRGATTSVFLGNPSHEES